MRCGFGQPDLVRVVPAHGRGVGLEGLSRSLPTQTILWFSDSRVLWFYDRPGQARQGALLLCSPGPPCPTQPLPGPGTRGGSPAARHGHQHQHWHWHEASASALGFSLASPLLLHCFLPGDLCQYSEAVPQSQEFELNTDRRR